MLVKFAYVLLFPLIAIWRAFVYEKMWNWHCASFGAPKVAYGAAMGLTCLAAWIKGRHPVVVEEFNWEWLLAQATHPLVVGSVLLLVSWLAS